MKVREKYSDIIDLERPVSLKHKPMSKMNRAAQFAAFAALTGYDEEVKEIARRTQDFIEIDENARELLDLKLTQIDLNQLVEVTYFEEDHSKIGGSYLQYVGQIKKIDEVEKQIIFVNGKRILIQNIFAFEQMNKNI